MKALNNLMLIIVLTTTSSFGQVKKSCIKNYESPKSLSQLFEESLSTSGSSFTFLPLAITDFLTKQHDEIYNKFEAQLERLSQIGDQNLLSSSAKVSKIAMDKNNSALTKVQKKLNPGALSLSRLKSTEKKSEELEKLISEANQCKLQTNTCIQNLQMAMKASDQNIASIEKLIQEMTQFQDKIKSFQNYIEVEKSRHYRPQDIEYSLVAIESKKKQIEATLTMAYSVLDVNKKNLISASFLLEESYMVNQRTKEVRAEGAYNLTDWGSSPPSSQAIEKKESVFKKTWNELTLKRKAAIQNSQLKLRKHALPLLLASPFAIAGTFGYFQSQKFHENTLRQQESVLIANLDNKSPGFSEAFRAAKSIPDADDKNNALLDLYYIHKKHLNFDEVQLIVNSLSPSYNQDYKPKILNDFSKYLITKKPTENN